MSFVTAALIVGGSALVGGAISAYGANSAASTQADAQKQAAATQQGMFNTINGQEQPFMQAGYKATSRLNDLMGTSGNTSADGYGSLSKQFTGQDFLNNQDPGYQWQKDQGAQALRNSDTPGVGALSGAALKDLMGFNQGMASTGYQNAFNRFQTSQNAIFGRLSGIASMGQNAASNTGQVGASLGSGIAQAQAAAGASYARGISSGANSIGQSISMAGLLSGGGGGNSSPGYFQRSDGQYSFDGITQNGGTGGGIGNIVGTVEGG